MKNIVRSSLFVISIVLSTLAFTGTVLAQNQLKVVADTGVVTLGPNQILRVTVGAGDGNDTALVRFRQTEYEPCLASPKLCIRSQTISNPIVLAPHEVAIVDAADYVVWRTVVLSNRRNVKVTGIVFDTSTQRVVTQIMMANTEVDFQ